MKLFSKKIFLSFCVKMTILVLLFFLKFNFANAQICDSTLISKYSTISKKAIGNSNIMSLRSHSVVSVKGGFWLGGLATLNTGDIDFFYAKLDDTGKLLLFKTVGLITSEGGYSVRLAATPTGGLIIAGQSFENSIGIKLAAIVSIDNLGNVKWYRKTPSAGNYGILDAIRGVFVEPNGEVFCVGDAQQYSNLNYSRVLVCKLDSNGNQKFINQIELSINGSPQQAHPSGIQSTSYGYLISGWISSGQIPFMLLVDKTNGISISSIYLNSSSVYSPDKLIFLPSGNAILVGYTNVNGTRDGFVASIDFKKNKINWQKAIASSPGAADLFNHVYYEKGVLYMSIMTNGLGGNGNRQGFVSLDTNGQILSGNSIYMNSLVYETAHSGNDFDVLKSGGAVFLGQDDGIADAHINFVILCPCIREKCAYNSFDYTSSNTNLTISGANHTDYIQGNLTNENPDSRSHEFETTVDCLDKKPKNEALEYYLFNSFSPGADESNDVFKLGHKGKQFNYNILIYNRWGELVFETQNASINDESKFWNGQVMNDGTDCPAGTYFVIYQLYIDGNGKSPKELHGTVNLIR